MRFIAGIVSDPVVTVFAMDDPLIDPNIAEDTTATLAGPPGYLPAMIEAMSMKNCPSPMRVASTPNSTKWKTKVATTFTGMPKMPSCVR